MTLALGQTPPPPPPTDESRQTAILREKYRERDGGNYLCEYCIYVYIYCICTSVRNGVEGGGKGREEGGVLKVFGGKS